MKQNLLLVEDDEQIAFAVKSYLQDKNFTVETVKTINEAKRDLENKPFILIILDWNLPDGNGNQLCSWIRSKWAELPVIFLTVRGDTKDIIEGFLMGADDYVVKPFQLEVLHSRICAILRRSGNESRNNLRCGPISIDKERIRVFYEKEEIFLSALEYRLLLVLMENKNYTLPRNRLLDILWDAKGNFVNDNTLTVTMKRLREKLHNPGCLKTVRSFGYRMEDQQE